MFSGDFNTSTKKRKSDTNNNVCFLASKNSKLEADNNNLTHLQFKCDLDIEKIYRTSEPEEAGKQCNYCECPEEQSSNNDIESFELPINDNLECSDLPINSDNESSTLFCNSVIESSELPINSDFKNSELQKIGGTNCKKRTIEFVEEATHCKRNSECSDAITEEHYDFHANSNGSCKRLCLKDIRDTTEMQHYNEEYKNLDIKYATEAKKSKNEVTNMGCSATTTNFNRRSKTCDDVLYPNNNIIDSSDKTYDDILYPNDSEIDSNSNIIDFCDGMLNSDDVIKIYNDLIQTNENKINSNDDVIDLCDDVIDISGAILHQSDEKLDSSDKTLDPNNDTLSDDKLEPNGNTLNGSILDSSQNKYPARLNDPFVRSSDVRECRSGKVFLNCNILDQKDTTSTSENILETNSSSNCSEIMPALGNCLTETQLLGVNNKSPILLLAKEQQELQVSTIFNPNKSITSPLPDFSTMSQSNSTSVNNLTFSCHILPYSNTVSSPKNLSISDAIFSSNSSSRAEKLINRSNDFSATDLTFSVDNASKNSSNITPELSDSSISEASECGQYELLPFANNALHQEQQSLSRLSTLLGNEEPLTPKVNENLIVGNNELFLPRVDEVVQHAEYSIPFVNELYEHEGHLASEINELLEHKGYLKSGVKEPQHVTSVFSGEKSNDSLQSSSSRFGNRFNNTPSFQHNNSYQESKFLVNCNQSSDLDQENQPIQALNLLDSNHSDQSIQAPKNHQLEFDNSDQSIQALNNRLLDLDHSGQSIQTSNNCLLDFNHSIQAQNNTYPENNGQNESGLLTFAQQPYDNHQELQPYDNHQELQEIIFTHDNQNDAKHLYFNQQLRDYHRWEEEINFAQQPNNNQDDSQYCVSPAQDNIRSELNNESNNCKDNLSLANITLEINSETCLFSDDIQNNTKRFSSLFEDFKYDGERFGSPIDDLPKNTGMIFLTNNDLTENAAGFSFACHNLRENTEGSLIAPHCLTENAEKPLPKFNMQGSVEQRLAAVDQQDNVKKLLSPGEMYDDQQDKVDKLLSSGELHDDQQDNIEKLLLPGELYDNSELNDDFAEPILSDELKANTERSLLPISSTLQDYTEMSLLIDHQPNIVNSSQVHQQENGIFTWLLQLLISIVHAREFPRK